ncbi:DUF2786 domain-containing protein [Acidimicrobiales bacterium]|nr:DUF2786 domain-containing protein [Acidimicrobiales bacterium]
MNTIITRVQALIAKAESSPYPAEADAFMAKAQQLINDHAIDQARLTGADPTSVGHDTVPMTGTYTKERSLIWSAAAKANRCQILTLSGYGSSKVASLTLIGREQDRQLVRLLATSLELQALKRLDSLDPQATAGSPVVQKRSFLRGFALEVADRLRRSGHTHAVVGQAAEQALVLARDAVDRYVGDNFDVSRGRRATVRHDGLAFSHGRRAGASADVGASRIGSDRRSLPPG